MTNTILNVPRELLERLAEYAPAGFCAPTALQGFALEARRLLSAQSPAGVGGWDVECAATYVSEFMRAVPSGLVPLLDGDQLCRLPDAQAIIDGLRVDVEVMTQHANNYSRMFEECAKERDQHAQRIGELETALEFACKSLAQVTSSDGSGHADIAVSVLRMAGRKEIDASQIVEAYKAGAKWRIDAALSSGKEGE